jgi:hypothetical protein
VGILACNAETSTQNAAVAQNAPCGNVNEVLDSLYQQFLDRDITDAERKQAASLLTDSGKTVRMLIDRITLSKEFQDRFMTDRADSVVVMHLYRKILGREPERVGLVNNIISARRRGLEHVRTYFLNESPEYTRKYGDNTVPGKRTTYRPCPPS